MSGVTSIADYNQILGAIGVLVFWLTLFQLLWILHCMRRLLAELRETTSRSFRIAAEISTGTGDDLDEVPLCCETSCEKSEALGGFCEGCWARSELPSGHPASLRYTVVPPEEARSPVRDEDQNSQRTLSACSPRSAFVGDGEAAL